jgi:uncharacterized protein (DUF1778 family)
MATSKPRITVTLTQRQHDVLKSISDNSGQSMSAFVNELLAQSMPVLERMAESFRKIKEARDEQKKRIVEELDQAQATMEPILGQVLGQFDLFMARLEGATGAAVTDAAAGRAGAVASEARQTPATNRGVTTTPTHPPKPAPRKALRAVSASRVSSKKRGA